MENNSFNLAKRLKTKSECLDETNHDSVRTNEGHTCWKSEDANLSNPVKVSISHQLLTIELKYNQFLRLVQFKSPVAYVYSPIDYAIHLHSQYILKYCQSQKEILILAMNPGPWGMSQTGIPFGEVSLVRNWLHIHGKVEKPPEENQHRPVLGLECQRSEVSGKRFWEALKRVFGNDPYSCLNNIHVHNYCPLAFMENSGKNITPAELTKQERIELGRSCDQLLIEVLLLLGVKTIVAVGRFAEAQAKHVTKTARLDFIKLLYIPHPSPRCSGSTESWIQKATEVLISLRPEAALQS